ncbi:MAG: putative alpha/beta hydrolase [Frankiales bacterium]|nr:putative alpha/beta hydrolase [Frankiales bacterium]
MRVDSNGLTFDVSVEGPEDGTPVLLLHGFPQSNHCWRLVRPYLEDCRTVAPNQRGYSPGTQSGSYAMPELIQDALGILDALGIEKANVVGHDWGAAVAWQLTARHPQRVRTLTAVSVPHPQAFIHALRTDEDQRNRSQYMRTFSEPGYAATLLADDGAAFRTMFGPAPGAVDVDHMLAMARQPGALDAWLQWYADQKLPHSIDCPKVTVPTLHVWSDGDAALGRAGTDATAEWVDAPYRLEVLHGVSHWIPEEAADRLGPLIRGHIS